jgi:arylsulfatase A-like enzyme
MGHAYTLFPEIVRVPLIVHVPAGLRDRYSWDTRRASFTTDITPTLYRLLGHDATSPGEFYGESLARLPGTGAAQSRSRMVAASYGSVYGAVLEDGTRLYVADAIERREWAFSLGEGATTGGTIEVTSGLRREAAQVIEHTVHSIARAYRLPPR